MHKYSHFLSSGQLVSTHSGPFNTVDLTQALAAACGVPLQDQNDAARAKVLQALGIDTKSPPKHILLVLLDGCGMNILDRLDAHHDDGTSFLKNNFVVEMKSVFPATTAAALTALSTGVFPSQHANLGWCVSLKDQCESNIAALLPFVDYVTGDSLSTKSEDVFFVPSLWSRISHHRKTFIFSAYANTTFSTYMAGPDAQQLQGETIDDLVDQYIQMVRESDQPTFSYIYSAEPDHMEHSHGFRSSEAMDALKEHDKALKRLVTSLQGQDVKVVVTADHGHVEIDEKLMVPDDILELLVHPPSVEPRTPNFHVKPGCEETFKEKFHAFAGESFFLLTKDEALELELYGPNPPHPEALRRMGDFIAITTTDHTLWFKPNDMKGTHGGMTPQEMRIPLISHWTGKTN